MSLFLTLLPIFSLKNLLAKNAISLQSVFGWFVIHLFQERLLDESVKPMRPDPMGIHCNWNFESDVGIEGIYEFVFLHVKSWC